MSLNFNEICRACMTHDENLTSLYDIYEHDLTLASILQTCLHSSTKISEDDELPGQLCDSCILVLTQFYNFSVVYEDSEQQLRTALENAVKAIDTKEEFLEVPFLNTETLVLEDPATTQLTEGSVTLTPCETEEENFYGFKSDDNLQELKNEENDYIYVELDADNNQVALTQAAPSTHRSEPYERVKKYECNLCGEAHLYPVSFQHHMRFKHNLNSINCDDYATEVHIKQEKSSEDDDKSNKEFIYHCKFCSKEFLDSIDLREHIRSHDFIKKYVCDVCGSRFLRKSYLDDHMEGHSNEKKHTCKFCGKSFRRRTVLRAHKRLHTHPNHYVCELCGRAFTNASTLKTHNLLIHLKERKFKCVICNLSFPLKSTLTKHVLRHQKRENGEKGFDCEFCEMQYKDKSSLKRHIDFKHLGKVQYVSCPDCSKKYASKANLMKHRRKNH